MAQETLKKLYKLKSFYILKSGFNDNKCENINTYIFIIEHDFYVEKK